MHMLVHGRIGQDEQIAMPYVDSSMKPHDKLRYAEAFDEIRYASLFTHAPACMEANGGHPTRPTHADPENSGTTHPRSIIARELSLRGVGGPAVRTEASCGIGLLCIHAPLHPCTDAAPCHTDTHFSGACLGRSFYLEHVRPAVRRYFAAEALLSEMWLYDRGIDSYAADKDGAVTSVLLWNVQHADLKDVGLTDIVAAGGSDDIGGQFGHASHGLFHPVTVGDIMVVNSHRLHSTAEFQLRDNCYPRMMSAFFMKADGLKGTVTGMCDARERDIALPARKKVRRGNR